MLSQRDIIKTLLAKKLPERMGLNEHFWPFLLENAWAAQGYDPKVRYEDRFNLDVQSVGWEVVPEPRPDLAKVVEQDENSITQMNGWGAITKLWKKKSGTPEHVGFTLNSPEIWKKDFREALIAFDVRAKMDLPKLREEFAQAQASGRFVTFPAVAVFETLRVSLGDEYMLESLLLEKEFIHDFNAVVTKKNIEVMEALFSEVGLPDGVHIYEDLGYTRAAFASPAVHRELILPYHKKFWGFIKDYHLPIIVHTCGDFRPHIESLIEAGTDCIQAMEAKTSMSVVDLAAKYKDKLCFMGNLDIRAFETGDRNKIKEECLGKMNGMKKLRAPYIFMSDHSIPPTVKLSDYEYALQLYKDNCKY